MFRSLVLTLAALALGTSTLSAAIIIHEPYNGYTPGAINSVNPNSNTTGLDTSGVYTGGTGFTFSATGLSFGSGATTLVTSGGSMSVNNSGGAAMAGPISLVSAYTGTLYSSFLYRTNVQGTSPTEDVFRQSISSSTASANQRFRVDPISGNNGATGSDVVAGAYLGSNPTDGTGVAAVGTTYLFLGRFTNVGGALSAGTPGEATIYMLTQDQFNNFKLGGLLDTELDSAAVGSSFDQVAGKATASATSGTTNVLTASGLFYQVASLGSGTNLQSSFDELRYGDSYDAVTPVPEPTTISLMILGGLGLLIGTRRRA